jgi:hypothetical protein
MVLFPYLYPHNIVNILAQRARLWVTPGRGLSVTLLCSTYFWSIGVMECWKNENPIPIFCNFKQKPSRFSGA